MIRIISGGVRRASASRYRLAVLGLTMGVLAGLATMGACQSSDAASNHSIQEVFAPDVHDLSLKSVPKRVNMDELEKIGKDFANTYRVSGMNMMLKEPDKFRIEAWAGPLRARYVINGGRKVTYVWGKAFRQRPFGDDPGKRQTPLELGLVTPGTLRGYVTDYVGSGTEAGRPVHRFKLAYAHDRDRYELISVDAERKCLVKRELRTRDGGKLKVTFTFHEPQKFGEVWVPTRTEIRNAEGKLAGITEQSEIKVNPGLDESLFKL